MNSGFCNPHEKAINQAHDRCEMPDCECACHQRFAVVWTDWLGESQIQEGFHHESDARLLLGTLKRLEFIPPDSEIEVLPYQVGTYQVGTAAVAW